MALGRGPLTFKGIWLEGRLQAAFGDLEKQQTLVAIKIAKVREASRHSFDKAPLPDRFGINVACCRQEASSLANQVGRVASQ